MIKESSVCRIVKFFSVVALNITYDGIEVGTNKGMKFDKT
jgi:hypothetical protein